MERIRQALERAREERVSATATLPPEPPSTDPAGPVSYTHTRRVELSPQQLRERRIVSAFEAGPYRHAHKILHTQVLQRLRDNGWNTLAVTSATHGEGKTLTALNLAVSLSQALSHTVLLVDADLQHPQLHARFGLPPGRGLSDYLLGEAELPDLLVHPSAIGRLVLLPGGRAMANSAELLGSPRMAALVDELKRRYASRIVVFDLPPLLASADVLAFAPSVEAVLLVVEDERTSAEDVRRAAGLLQKTHLIGTVLNKSRSAGTESTVVPTARSGPVERALRTVRRLFTRS
ncbi:MAG: CpsD/CapB family tyrosine-protein kinase [Nevskiales bacterium]|nr:CpsD/CapB family tyrosine-protein kinase [Nevskiales bacterium]